MSAIPGLDDWKTGHYGQAPFRRKGPVCIDELPEPDDGEPPTICPDCHKPLRENEDGWYCPQCGWIDDDGPEPQVMWCADCGGECRYDGQVWRCKVCDAPHEATGEPVRVDGTHGEEGLK